MVVLEALLDLPILWQSSTSLDSTLTLISERIDVTVDSRSESWTLPGMPEITKLLFDKSHSVFQLLAFVTKSFHFLHVTF